MNTLDEWKFSKMNSLKISMEDSNGYLPYIYIQSKNKIRCKISLLDNIYIEQSEFSDILNEKERLNFNKIIHHINKKTNKTLWEEMIFIWASKNLISYRSLDAQGKIPDGCPDYFVIKNDLDLEKNSSNKSKLYEELYNFHFSLFALTNYFDTEKKRLENKRDELLVKIKKFEDSSNDRGE